MISNLSSSSFGAEPNALTALFGGSVASAGASVSSSSQAASTSLYNSIHQHPGSVGSFSGHTSSGVSNHFGKPFPAMFGASAGDLLSYSQTSASAFDASLMKGVVSKEHQKSPTSPGSTLSVACSSGGHNSEVCNVNLYGVPIVSLIMDNQERLCLAQISNTLLKNYSYNEIHNRRVALGITCVQCTPVQLELLRRAGAMPVSSRRCGMITKREAERLCKSFLTETSPPKLPENFSFDVYHCCAWGCRGSFTPSRYNSSRAKCIKCIYCGLFFSPNKFIFHSHRLPSSKYIQPDAANFNSWRRHIRLVEQPEPTEQVVYAWEDVKAMFNGGSRKRAINSTLNSFTKNQEQRNAKNSHHKKSKDIDIDNDDDSDSIGITDDLEPQSGKSLCEMTDILDTSGSEEHCGHQPTSSPSPSKSLDSQAVNSSTSKPFWSMESYLNNSPNIIKSRNQLQSATPFGSNSDSLMNSYPFFGRSPLNDSRFPPPHPALLSSLLSTVPENYHFRNSLLGAANGGYPGGSGHTPTDLAKAPSFAELMWSMAARNGASTNPISNNPYHLLWSQSGLGPSQTSATTVRNSTSLGNVAAAAAASLLPHPSLTSHPIPVPTSVATSGTLGSQFDSEEFRKALLMNPTLFQNHRANSDFFQNITTGAPQGNDFPFFPVRPSEMSQFDSGDTRKGHKRAVLLSSVDEKLSLEKKIKIVEIDDLVDDSSEIVVTSDSKSIQDLDKDNDGSECDNLQL